MADKSSAGVEKEFAALGEPHNLGKRAHPARDHGNSGPEGLRSASS
jgi:hypothetical protein